VPCLKAVEYSESEHQHFKQEAFRIHPSDDSDKRMVVLIPGGALTVTHQEQGWAWIVPVKYLADCAPELPASRRITNFLTVLDRPKVKECDLDARIDFFFKADPDHDPKNEPLRHPEYRYVLGSDWNFETIRLSPIGLMGLVGPDPLASIFEFLRKIDDRLRRRTEGRASSAVAFAVFWRSWDLYRHLRDFCRELERQASAEMIEGARQVAVSKILTFVQDCDDRALEAPADEKATSDEESAHSSSRSHEERGVSFIARPSTAGEPERNKTGAESTGASCDFGDPVALERKTALRAYKEECRRANVKVTDKMVAMAAQVNWHDRTEIQRWKSNNPRSKPLHNRKIRKVLADKPHLPRPKTAGSNT
jgi:hypothetical protein